MLVPGKEAILVDSRQAGERNAKGSGIFSRPLRAMKTPDLFVSPSLVYSGGTTPANVNRSVM
jgi:hypothetical protein